MKTPKFCVLTLFPGFFDGPLRAGILGRAVQNGVLIVETQDLRPFGEGRHLITDDYPFGGGAGMVMKPGPVVAAIEAARRAMPESRVVLLTPQGRLFRQPVAREIASRIQVRPWVLVCGRYEGFDERIRSYCDDEISVGDVVLMGGEVASLVVIDAVARLLPGVLGDAESPVEESLSDGLLEYPQYTRPRDFRGNDVPDVLVSGHHGEVAAWRRRQSLLRTAVRRPDLFATAPLTAEEREWVRREMAGEKG